MTQFKDDLVNLEHTESNWFLMFFFFVFFSVFFNSKCYIFWHVKKIFVDSFLSLFLPQVWRHVFLLLMWVLLVLLGFLALISLTFFFLLFFFFLFSIFSHILLWLYNGHDLFCFFPSSCHFPFLSFCFPSNNAVL